MLGGSWFGQCCDQFDQYVWIDWFFDLVGCVGVVCGVFEGIVVFGCQDEDWCVCVCGQFVQCCDYFEFVFVWYVLVGQYQVVWCCCGYVEVGFVVWCYCYVVVGLCKCGLQQCMYGCGVVDGENGLDYVCFGILEMLGFWCYGDGVCYDWMYCWCWVVELLCEQF